MNNLQLYFSSKYNNLAWWYLASFARTPHPFNTDLIYSDPEDPTNIKRASTGESIPDIPQENILRRKGTEEDALIAINNSKNLEEVGYTPTQAQAIQRKHLLRRQALKLTNPNSTLPEVSNGRLLQSAYTTMRDPRIKEANNNIAALDRYRRSLTNQLTDVEKTMPIISAEEADVIKKKLATLAPEDWDALDTTYNSVKQIKEGGETATQAITDTNSPIGRGAKKDVVTNLRKRQRTLALNITTTGIDPRTGEPATLDTLNTNPVKPPSYVANPESVEYVLNDSPEAQANKTKKMNVRYTPDTGSTSNTGLQRRIDKIKRVRSFIEEDNKTPPVTTPSLPTINSNLTPDAFDKGLRQEIIDNPNPTNIEQAKYLLNNTSVKPRPEATSPNNTDTYTSKQSFKTQPEPQIPPASVGQPQPQKPLADPSIPPTPETVPTDKKNKKKNKKKTKSKTKTKTTTTVINQYDNKDNIVSRLFKNKKRLGRIGTGLLGAAAVAGGTSLILNRNKRKRQEAYNDDLNSSTY